VFVIGVPLMAITLALVALVPERPLRRAVREESAEPLPAAA
jgi:hypothetical protein